MTVDPFAERLAKVRRRFVSTLPGKIDGAYGAAQAAPGLPEVHLELGYAAASRGDFREAVASWQKYLQESSGAAPGAAIVRDAIASATALCTALEAHAGV